MDAAILYGSLPMVLENPRVSRGSKGVLDSFRARVLCGPNWESQAASLGFRMDAKVAGYASLWVKSMEPSEQSDDSAVIEISGEGLAVAGERRQRRMRCGEMQISVGPLEKVILVWNKDERGKDAETGEAVDEAPRRVPKLDDEGEPVLKTIVTPSGTQKRWLVSEAEVTVIDTYYVTTEPSMTAAGGVFTPPNAPDVPPYLWAGYNEIKRGRHPNGWVLVDRDVEEIASASSADGLWRVTDTCVYRQVDFPE